MNRGQGDGKSYAVQGMGLVESNGDVLWRRESKASPTDLLTATGQSSCLCHIVEKEREFVFLKTGTGRRRHDASRIPYSVWFRRVPPASFVVSLLLSSRVHVLNF